MLPPSLRLRAWLHRHSLLRRGLLALLGLVPVLLAAGVLTSAGASFVGQSDSSTGFAAGTVALADNDGSVAPFNVPAAEQGDSGQRCVRVTYSGSLDVADVRLYAPAGGGPLGPYLQLTVQAGTGAQLDCGDFAAGSTLTTQTLTDLAASAGSYATGLGGWAPTGGSNATRTYRVAWSLPVLPAGARGSTANVTLRWEARTP